MQLIIILTLTLTLTCSSATAQQKQFVVHELSLPDVLRSGDNQFSGLYIDNGKLYLMAESRIQENAEAKLYSIALQYLDKKIKDNSFQLPFQKYKILNLHLLSDKIAATGNYYEGLEAIIADKGNVLFSVETTTASPDCFLVKGVFEDSTIMMDTSYLVAISKPKNIDGTTIYNAGFEAIAKTNNLILNFFEYNYFANENFSYALDIDSLSKNKIPAPIPIKKIPFRTTDITSSTKNHFTAVNYFYKGGANDTVYRMPKHDQVNGKLIKDKAGYKNYSRLIDIKLKNNHLTWNSLWEFPKKYMNHNWEGIAAYHQGYFVINDKYTAGNPQSVLLFLQRVR